VAQGVQDFDREHRATERLGQAAMQVYNITTHVNAMMRPKGEDVVGRGMTRAVTVLR
jgi:hypothetical protein